MLELLSVLGVGFVKCGIDTYKYKYRFFKYFSQILFNEVLGLHLDKVEIKKHSLKLAQRFQIDDKNLSRLDCWKTKRKYFKVFSNLGLLLKKVDKSVFEVLLKKGHIWNYLTSIDKIKEFIKIIKITQNLSESIWNFMNIIDINNNDFSEEKAEVFMELFLIVKEGDLGRFEEVFNDKLEEYKNTNNYKTRLYQQKKVLITLLLGETGLKGKDRKILKSISRVVEDIEINTLFEDGPKEVNKADVKNINQRGSAILTDFLNIGDKINKEACEQTNDKDKNKNWN